MKNVGSLFCFATRGGEIMASYKYKSDEWYESEPVNVTVGSVAIGNATVFNATGTAWIGLVSTASINGKVNLATLISGEDQTNDVLKVEGQFSHWYTSGPTVDAVVKGSAGFLHSIIVGGAVATSTIEISDHATDGDGAVKIFLEGNTLGPMVYPVNAKFATGITTDIINQTKVTLIFR